MAVELHVYAGCGCAMVSDRQAGDDLIVEAPGAWHRCPGHAIPDRLAVRADAMYADAFWSRDEVLQDRAVAILGEWS